MSQKFPERYSDLDESQQPSKERDQRQIAGSLMEKGISVDRFPFKRADDDRDEMIVGIQGYGAKLLGLSTAVTEPAVEPISPQTPESSESQKETSKKSPFTALPFAELAALLSPKDINLQQQLDDHVSFMVKHGAIQKHEADSYRDRFETIHVNKEELDTVPKGYRPMLFIDNQTPVQSAKTFITGTGIRLHEYSNLSEFQKVDPKTEKPLKNHTPSDLARLTFTPDVTNLTPDLTGKSADQHLEQMQQGKRYLESSQWFQLFVEGLQRAIKELNLGNGKDWKDMTPEEKQLILNNKRIDPYLPDSETWTQCPDWRNNAGDALLLYWLPGNRDVCVGSDHPQGASADLGSRPALS